MLKQGLILLFSLVASAIAVAEGTIVSVENNKTHLRLNVFVPEKQIVIQKSGDTVSIKTLNLEIFKKLSESIKGITLNPTYVAKVEERELEEGNLSSVELKLSKPNVELFQFYRANEQKYVLDLWIDGELVPEVSKSEAKPVVTKIENLEPTPAPLPKKMIAEVKKVAVVPSVKKEEKKSSVSLYQYEDKGYRDFRYGASFVWDYAPFIPELPRIINLESKTPETFYPIANRAYDKNEKESHLQLVVNLYRKKKFGLMYKAITMFQQKYGQETENDFIEYIKANAIIRDNLVKNDRAAYKMAINMFTNIVEKTQNYQIKQAILKYLVASALANQENVQALQMAKKLYVASKESFETEDATFAVEVILYGFAQLFQTDKIKEIIIDPSIKKLLPAQTLLAYDIFAEMKNGHSENVVSLFEKNKKGLQNPINSVVLFNTAESYFRLGRYPEAIEVFQAFLTSYSPHVRAGEARLRLALAHDLLGKDPQRVTELYEDAINRSVNGDLMIEAKFRFLGMKVLRKKEPTAKDFEYLTFLEFDDKGKNLNKDLSKLLWQIRVRSLIVQKKFNDAITYLAAIPTSSLKQNELRAFDGDGAEAVYGVMLDAYVAADFAKVIRLWEAFQKKYIQKMAFDPYLNYIASVAYLRLKMFDGFDVNLAAFKGTDLQLTRTFPEWTSREGLSNPKLLLSELSLMRNLELKNWELAQKDLDQIIAGDPKYARNEYFSATIAYGKGDLKTASKLYQSYLANLEKKSIYDINEMADLLGNFSEALKELGEKEMFIRVVDAFMDDLNQLYLKHDYMKRTLERLNYLAIEMVSEGTSSNGTQLESRLSNFKKKFPGSGYEGRIDYLLGVHYLKGEKKQEGENILKSLIAKEGVASYIKEMAKSELSLQRIKEKTL